MSYAMAGAADSASSEIDENTYDYLFGILANATTDGNQITPNIAYISDGILAVTWESESSNGNSDIYLRLFDEWGNPVTDEILVSEGIDASLSSPEIVHFIDGYFYVSFYEMEDLYNLGFESIAHSWGTLFNIEGEQEVGLFAFNDDTAPDLRLLRNVFTYDDLSRLVLTQTYVWTDGGTPAHPTNSDVRIQAYAVDPFERLTSLESIAGDESPAWEFNPQAIAMDDGGFLLLWNERSSSDSSSLHAQYYDNDGNAAGDPFRIATNVTHDMENLGVSAATLEDGSYVIVWEALEGFNSSTIFARHYSAQHEALTDAFIVSEATQGGQAHPTVSALENGGYAIFWESAGLDGDGLGIEAAYYNMPHREAASASNDSLYGLGTDDKINGLAGDDVITGGTGADTLIGGEGADTLSGGWGNDQLWAGAGDNGDDVYDGGSGNDTLGGGAGNDLLYGGSGSDVLFGGLGDDTLYGLYNTTGSETTSNQIWAGAGDDIIVSTNGSDALGGGEGNDHIVAGGGNDLIYAGQTGSDTLEGGSGSDTLFGGTEADSIQGNSGADELYGGSGSDTVDGGSGDDTLYGGSGNDTLTGGTGNDTLRPGDGADLLVFSAGDGIDVVDGFNTGEDTLDLSATTADFTDIASVEAAASETEDGVLIDLGGGDSLLLSNLVLDDLGNITIVF